MMTAVNERVKNGRSTTTFELESEIRLYGGRCLIGCSSVTTQDTEEGSAMYYRLEEYLVDPELRTKPTPAFAFAVSKPPVEKPCPPKLLRAYLGVGARIGGEPALDREFKTIDFLTLLDLEKMAPSAGARYVR